VTAVFTHRMFRDDGGGRSWRKHSVQIPFPQHLERLRLG